MASVVLCEKCGKEKSTNVNACPHCGYHLRKKYEMAPCRACGTLLEKAVHNSFRGGMTTVNGAPVYHRYLVHEPCPKCGDPKPLRYLFWGAFFYVIIGFAVTGGCSVFGMNLWPKNNDPHVTEKMLTIGIMVLAWIIFVVFMNRLVNRRIKGAQTD